MKERKIREVLLIRCRSGTSQLWPQTKRERNEKETGKRRVRAT